MGIFADKIALVTGGASGIGRALSEALAARGAHVTLADKNANMAKETAEGIVKAGHRAKAVALDVTDFAAFKKLVDDTVTECGRLDYIFNNAGIAVLGEARDYSYDDWRRVIDTDLYGVVNGVAAAYPVMIKQGFGHIINTASLAGLVPATGLLSYTTSKHGVVGLSNALRIEGADLGVKVSVVCPGLVQTPIYNSKTVGIDRDKMLENVPKGIPPEECARVVLDGVERNKAIITVTAVAKIWWALHRLSPSIGFWLGRRLVKRMRKLRVEP